MVKIVKSLWIDECDLDFLSELRNKRGCPLNRSKLSKNELDEYMVKSF